MSASPPSTLLVPLEKPPQAFSLTVRKIIGKVIGGEIRVPDFQRPLRWQATDVARLFDSILRGYPVGSLLFWKHAFEADTALRIGNARITVPAIRDGWFIVDGQQRITALAAALSDIDHHGDLRWQVRFDPTTNTFLTGATKQDELPRHVPLSALGDLRRLGHWLRDCELSDAAQTRVEEVQQRLLDYELPAYLMETDNPDGLKGAFARLNSTGVRMRSDEVFQALLGSRSRHRGPLDLEGMQRACDLNGFGQPPRPEVLKAVLAMSDFDPTRRLEDLGEEALSRLVSETDAIEALQRTVNFLQSGEDPESPGPGIPAYCFIPYPVVFVVLARWFYLFPETDELTRRELSRWLWRGVVSGVHQRAAVSKMRLQVRNVVKDDLEGSLAALLKSVGEPARVDWSLEPFHANHAASRVEILALLAEGPRDQRAPISWQALISDGQRVAREILASSAWKNLDGEAQQLAKTAANRALLDARHSGLRAEFKLWNADADRSALESHLIDQQSYQALVDGREDWFVKHRASRVRGVVSTFLTKRAGLGQPRLRPADAYFEPISEENSGNLSP